MEINPSLHTKSMDVQLQALIIDTFQYLSPSQCFYLVIIDGLDDCHDKAIQQLILRLLCETITIHKLPLRFLIGSRIFMPVSIRNLSIQSLNESSLTKHLILEETFGCFSKMALRNLCPVSRATTVAQRRHY